MKEIVTIAMNPAIDKSSSVEYVIAERKLYCKTPHYEPGGGGVNVSRAVKKLGGESILLYPADGLSGHLLKDLLDQEGLNYQPFLIEGMTRENLIVLEELPDSNSALGCRALFLRMWSGRDVFTN